MHSPARARLRPLILLPLLTLLAAALTALPARAATVRYEAENATDLPGRRGVQPHRLLRHRLRQRRQRRRAATSSGRSTPPAAGTATLDHPLRQRHHPNRPADITVNGTVVAAGRAFNSTGNWDTWATSTLTAPLNAGANTVRVTATTASGNPNLDYLDVAVADARRHATTRRRTPTISQATVATNHTGFTGTGFVDYVNAAGGYVEWTVNAAAGGHRTP